MRNRNDVDIGQLRKKIVDVPDDPRYPRTVRGLGSTYRMSDTRRSIMVGVGHDAEGTRQGAARSGRVKWESRVWHTQCDTSIVSDDRDRVLVQCATEGDRAALAALFAHHHLRVFRSAYLVVRSPEAADDIVQLVFLELFRALHTFDPRRPFLPWLYRIVHNVSIDYLRREHCRRPALPLLDCTPDPFGATAQVEARAILGPALDALTLEHREALVLRYFVGLSEREMAAALGVRPGTVKSRLHRALRAVGEALGPGNVPSLGNEAILDNEDTAQHGEASL